LGKSNKSHWDESELKLQEARKLTHSLQEALQDEDMHSEEDMWEEEIEEDEWIEAEMIEQETSQHYFNDAHEALSKLTQKSNKRAQHQQKRPKRAEVWH
jgi:hypothetical protein